MRFWPYAVASTTAAAALVLSSLARYPNFYSATVAASSTFAALMVLCNFMVMVGFVVAFGLMKLFFGSLRQIEVEGLTEYGGLVVFYTVITLCSASMEPYTFSVAAGLYISVYVRLFHYLAKKRVQMFFTAVEPPSKWQQARILSLLATLLAVDIALCRHAFTSFMAGDKNQVLFALDYCEMLQMQFSACATFVIDKLESKHMEETGEYQWELKPTLVFITTAIVQAFRVVCVGGLMFVLHLVVTPLLLPLFLSVTSLWVTVRNFVRAQRAQSRFDSYVTTAVFEDFSHDTTCVVCREEMEVEETQARLVPKRLVCGHVMHHGCLKMWMGQSQTCPVCRESVKPDGKTRPRGSFGVRQRPAEPQAAPALPRATSPPARQPEHARPGAPAGAVTSWQAPGAQAPGTQASGAQIHRGPTATRTTAAPTATTAPTATQAAQAAQAQAPETRAQAHARNNWTRFKVRREGGERQIQIDNLWRSYTVE